MKKKQDNSLGASAFQIALALALISISAVLFASGLSWQPGGGGGNPPAVVIAPQVDGSGNPAVGMMGQATDGRPVPAAVLPEINLPAWPAVPANADASNPGSFRIQLRHAVAFRRRPTQTISTRSIGNRHRWRLQKSRALRAPPRPRVSGATRVSGRVVLCPRPQMTPLSPTAPPLRSTQPRWLSISPSARALRRFAIRSSHGSIINSGRQRYRK